MGHERSWAAVVAAVLAVAGAGPAHAEEDTWDGLTRVEGTRLERVYVLKGADFRRFGKVIVQPPQVAFRKDWAEDVSRGVREPGRRITKSDVERIQKALSQGFRKILADDFAKAGWKVVDAAGPDVLQLTPLLLNVDITAPQKLTDARVDTYTVSAGQATVALEVRDSETGMILGRAADRRSTLEHSGRLMVTDRVTNQADFQSMLMGWSRIFVEGLGTLQGASPGGAAKGG